MSQSLTSAILFLISTLFDFYLVILCVRLILAYEKANYFNPIIRFIIIATQRIVSPLRRLIPTIYNIEYATLFLMIFLGIMKVMLISLVLGASPTGTTIVLYALFGTIRLIMSTFFYSILIYAVLSWISTHQTPLTQVLAQLSAPLLRPLHRVIPLVGGFDITPLIALIVLQVIMILLPGL